MCDTVVRVDADGVWFAKNSDRDINECQVLTWVAGAEDARAETGPTVACTYIEVPQVEATHAVVLSRPFWMWGAEMGVNDAGVAIGNEAVFTDQPLAEVGLTGMDMVRLALQRSTSAESAVATIVDLLERHGQGGGCGLEDRSFSYHNSFLVADRDEAWVVETAGKLWATERVTAGVRSISNGLTIESFARQHADRLRNKVVACATRSALTARSAATAETPLDWFALTRDHGPTGQPDYGLLAGGLGAPCAHPGGLVANSQTTNSWVSHLSGAGDRHWSTGTAAPCTSTFTPVTVDESWPVDIYGDEALASDRFDGSIKWWRHEVLHRFVMADPNQRLSRFRADRDRLEARFVAEDVSAQEALAEIEHHERAWLADMASCPDGDVRPWIVKRNVRKRAHAAGLPSPQQWLIRSEPKEA